MLRNFSAERKTIHSDETREFFCRFLYHLRSYDQIQRNAFYVGDLEDGYFVQGNSFKFLSLQIFPIMGRGRGKGKKQIAVATREDNGSGEEEKIPTSKKRGRPQKLLKDEIDEAEETENIQEKQDGEILTRSITNKDIKKQASIENARKRMRSSEVEQNLDLVKQENSVDLVKPIDSDSIKSIGFRQIGSRRKNKPRRAAEVGVECM